MPAWAVPLIVLPRRTRGVAGLLAALGAWLLMGCSSSEPKAYRQPEACARDRLVTTQLLFQAARSNLVKHYKERSAASLNAAYNFAVDAITVGRASRSCRDADPGTRAAALNLMRMSLQLRNLAQSTMRDPDAQVAVTLLQEQYGEVFGGRDIE
jgi:hypothetical protein